MKVFVDTGALITLTDADDANHKAAAVFYRSTKDKGVRLITTNFVMYETMNYLRSRISHQVAVLFRESLNKSGFIEIIRVTPWTTVVKISISLRQNEEAETDAEVTYTYIALSEAGKDFVNNYTESYYIEFMQYWEAAINAYLSSGEP